MKNICLIMYKKNINENIFNNYLIDKSHHIRVLFFQKLSCHRYVPVHIPLLVFVLLSQL